MGQHAVLRIPEDSRHNGSSPHEDPSPATGIRHKRQLSRQWNFFLRRLYQWIRCMGLCLQRRQGGMGIQWRERELESGAGVPQCGRLGYPGVSLHHARRRFERQEIYPDADDHVGGSALSLRPLQIVDCHHRFSYFRRVRQHAILFSDDHERRDACTALFAVHEGWRGGPLRRGSEPRFVLGIRYRIGCQRHERQLLRLGPKPIRTM